MEGAARPVGGGGADDGNVYLIDNDGKIVPGVSHVGPGILRVNPRDARGADCLTIERPHDGSKPSRVEVQLPRTGLV